LISVDVQGFFVFSSHIWYNYINKIL
jgi:hypothetical protein